MFRSTIIGMCGAACSVSAQTVPPPAPSSNPDAVILRLAQGAEWAPLPVDIVSGELIVQVRINGQLATVLLDNGTGATIIDTAFADRSGIKLGAAGPDGIPGAGAARISTRRTESIIFEVPRTLTIRGPLVAYDLSAMSKALGRRVDGILGGDVLNRLALMIQPDKRAVSIVTSGGITSDDPNRIVVPIMEGDCVEVNLNGVPFRLKIDLGYSGAIRLSDASWSRIFPASTPSVPSSQTTLDGASFATRIAKAELQMGRISARAAPIDSGYVPVDEADGLLGTGFFLQGTSILDLPKKQLMLIPRGQAAGTERPPATP